MARGKRIVRNGKVSWQAVARVGPKGQKKDRAGATFPTQQQARDEANRMEERDRLDRDRPGKPDAPTALDRMDFYAYARALIENNRNTRSSSKVNRLQRLSLLEHALAPGTVLADLDLRTSRAVLRALNGHRKANGQLYCAGVVRQAWGTYVATVRKAMEDELCSRDILPLDPDLPTVMETTKRTRLTNEEQRVLLEAFWKLQPTFAPLIELLRGTGVRIGEALALNVADFDPRMGFLSINKTLSRTAGGREINLPKSGKSRIIPLDEALAKTLKTHIGIRPQDAPIFPGRNGTRPADYSWFLSVIWRPVVKSIGMERLTPHALRHTHLSELIEANVPMGVIINRSGHASSAILDRTYRHVIRVADQAAVRTWQAWKEEQQAGNA